MAHTYLKTDISKLRQHAPILDVDQGVVKRRAVVSRERVALAQGAGGGEHIGGDDVVEQAFELGIAQVDAVERLEMLAEITLQGSAVANVVSVAVFQALQLANEAVFNLFLFDAVRS